MFMDISNNNHLKCFFVENDNLTESLNGIYLLIGNAFLQSKTC